MQLKKLTLQAFGPFKDKIVVDFEKDKIDKGLLLITGDTGAGKTTLFDAICYALYGETSGTVRTANSLRSDWASLDVETYVELEFYYKNKLYEVKRSPEYIRRSKRGDGETKQPASAEFNINGRIITKVNDVTKEIEELIGLDYKQFRQVAMLSQGEFTKFLLASSDEKTTIFRKIFNTYFYDNLQNKLKSSRLFKEDELRKVKDKIDVERKNLEPIIDIYGLNDDETIEVLTKAIEEKQSTVLTTKEARDKKNSEQTKVKTELTTLSDLNKKITEYEDSKNKLDNLFLSNINIKEEQKQYEYNINIARTITEKLKELEKENKSLEEKKEKLSIATKDFELKNKEYQEKQETFKQLDNYSKTVEKLSNELNEISNKTKDYKNYTIKQKELLEQEDEYKRITGIYDKQNELYENIRRGYFLNVSVELADTLKDGEACPVCGSTHHPKKANDIGKEYSKEDLEKAENNLKTANDLRKISEAKIEQLRTTLKEFNIPDNINIEEEKQKLEELYFEKREEKDLKEKEFNQLTKERDLLNSSLTSLTEMIKLYEGQIKGHTESIKEIDSLLNNIYTENNTTYEEYLEKKLENFELKELGDKIDSYNKTKIELESKIKTLEPEVKDKKIVDVSEKEEQFKAIFEEYQTLDKQLLELTGILTKLTDSTTNIIKFMDEYKDSQKEYTIIKVLSDTANGSLQGKQKITFENYVQAYFMSSVLTEANKRLSKMTDSRYELKKKETESKLNAKTGLDFSIFDSYTGKERDVASLSGGEKFKASLALALGLSDTISNNRGGIKIDSLFIDEGFGSLDSESLNQALNILSDLSGNDKLVGVISHVSELMSRIDNKIYVHKTNTGSNISIESNA